MSDYKEMWICPDCNHANTSFQQCEVCGCELETSEIKYRFLMNQLEQTQNELQQTLSELESNKETLQELQSVNGDLQLTQKKLSLEKDNALKLQHYLNQSQDDLCQKKIYIDKLQADLAKNEKEATQLNETIIFWQKTSYSKSEELSKMESQYKLLQTDYRNSVESLTQTDKKLKHVSSNLIQVSKTLNKTKTSAIIGLNILLIVIIALAVFLDKNSKYRDAHDNLQYKLNDAIALMDLNNRYSNALMLYFEGKYDEAEEAFFKLGSFNDSASMVVLIKAIHNPNYFLESDEHERLLELIEFRHMSEVVASSDVLFLRFIGVMDEWNLEREWMDGTNNYYIRFFTTETSERNLDTNLPNIEAPFCKIENGNHYDGSDDSGWERVWEYTIVSINEIIVQHLINGETYHFHRVQPNE